ncbi:hypothetical protein N7481_008498 [Penicillium waksmanii]|uniref:uncharacterized protein n=1 Tax=Penicillium waksmanii TaxID=69791 RepID=UPI002548127C|nr:uncharacterized protein N7481_008498 [Penicillium waksmanii]KAJ5974791.1 hypothetical protein N7481_008498 [Penicillium waksmanii]
MHRNQIAQYLLSSLAFAIAVIAYDSSLNFRPDNVTLNGLYHWVGSYYNGTTRVEITPFSGFAAKEKEQHDGAWCPNLQGKSFNTTFATLLALTEPSKYNAPNIPVNAFFTLWDYDYDFSVEDYDALFEFPWEWGLFSSSPVYEYYALEETKTRSYFNITLEKTDSAPYNLSATISEYGTLDLLDGKSLDFNMTACNSSREVTWTSILISDYWWSQMASNISYPDPSLDIQFDSRNANLTLDGYISARSPNLYGADTKIEAKIKLDSDLGKDHWVWSWQEQWIEQQGIP